MTRLNGNFYVNDSRVCRSDNTTAVTLAMRKNCANAPYKSSSGYAFKTSIFMAIEINGRTTMPSIKRLSKNYGRP